MSFSVFGFGSLVNRQTLPSYLSIERASVSGWRRAWRGVSRGKHGGRCALSVVPDAQSAIDGLIITFADEIWPQMAAREHNYDPLRLADRPEVILFRYKAERDRPGDRDHPVCLSYIDTTLQGFLHEFGPEGAARFMETTDGWGVPIVDDRDAPTYPRACPLSAEERSQVDALLEGVDAMPARPQEV